MLGNAVARRYALAFFELAEENNSLDKFETELIKAQATYKSDVKLDKFLMNKLIPGSEKKQLISDLFKGKLSEITVNFLSLLVDKRREDQFDAIVAEFKNYANDARNIADAEIVSAKELSESDLAQLKEKLACMTKKNVNITTTVDPSLKGGLIVKLGDKIIDGSLARRFEIMKQKLLQ